MNGHPGDIDSAFDGAASALTQGDLLEFIGGLGDASELDPSYGVIITAACDIEHDKYRGILTFVPLLTIDEYFIVLGFPAIGTSRVTSAESRLKDLLFELSNPPSFERLRDMISLKYSPEEIAKRLALEHGESARLGAQLKLLAATVMANATLSKPVSFKDGFEALNGLEAFRDTANSNPSKIPPRERIARDLEKHLDQLPGDLFLLTGLRCGEHSECVAYLRQFRSIRRTQVAITPFEEHSSHGNVRARRVGRLAIAPTQKLVQQAAAVFTDIGLPSERDDHLRMRMAELSAGWSNNGEVEQP